MSQVDLNALRLKSPKNIDESVRNVNQALDMFIAWHKELDEWLNARRTSLTHSTLDVQAAFKKLSGDIESLRHKAAEQGRNEAAEYFHQVGQHLQSIKIDMYQVIGHCVSNFESLNKTAAETFRTQSEKISQLHDACQNHYKEALNAYQDYLKAERPSATDKSKVHGMVETLEAAVKTAQSALLHGGGSLSGWDDIIQKANKTLNSTIKQTGGKADVHAAQNLINDLETWLKDLSAKDKNMHA